MEQKILFGLVFGPLAILKKLGADYEQLFRVFFYVFRVKEVKEVPNSDLT
jgi:hypothetical protein